MLRFLVLLRLNMIIDVMLIKKSVVDKYGAVPNLDSIQFNSISSFLTIFFTIQ